MFYYAESCVRSAAGTHTRCVRAKVRADGQCQPFQRIYWSVSSLFLVDDGVKDVVFVPDLSAAFASRAGSGEF